VISDPMGSQGEYKNDMRSGKGVNTWADGSKYEVFFATGQFFGAIFHSQRLLLLSLSCTRLMQITSCRIRQILASTARAHMTLQNSSKR